MYSGSTLTPYSGNLLGVHQKINRVAYRELKRLRPQVQLPKLETILHFEGDNGPDSIKRKSPAKDEPWHYLQPFDLEDNQLIRLIESHYTDLAEALRRNDMVRAAFEAAWLAHAVVDGLTPAHHYPYEEKLIELRGGEGIETRTTIRKKLVMPGETRTHMFMNNWLMWGPKGLFTTHAGFEWGVAVLLAPSALRWAKVTPDKLAAFREQPLGVWFRSVAQDVARMELYEAYYKTGWTIPLARRVKKQLAPALVQAVALVWYGAALEAGA